ncbi:MAG TPA: aconitase family protein, partial [Alphaproteobacteria bacterium]
MAKPRTLFDKIWDSHVVDRQEDGTCLIWVDRHIIHEITSAQAFDGLRQNRRRVRHAELQLCVPDHNVPTTNRRQGIADRESRIQIDALKTNAAEFGLPYIDILDDRQGIVHVIGPEQGFTQPGLVIVCGDSHTSTHGAFGALAFGIGTSEVEHVLATQTLIQASAKNMRVHIDGALPPGITAKDLILKIIGTIGTAGGTGHVIEYTGKAIADLSMEGRMTVCNMSIEGGARAGLVAPDEKTYAYIKGKPLAPKGGQWEQALAYWKTLPSDEGAT